MFRIFKSLKNGALKGKADYLVSGDTDLLELKKFESIKILSPAKFLEILEALSKS